MTCCTLPEKAQYCLKQQSKYPVPILSMSLAMHCSTVMLLYTVNLYLTATSSSNEALLVQHKPGTSFTHSLTASTQPKQPEKEGDIQEKSRRYCLTAQGKGRQSTLSTTRLSIALYTHTRAICFSDRGDSAMLWMVAIKEVA